MKKKVFIFSLRIKNSILIANQIEDLFPNDIECIPLVIEDEINNIDEGDLILASSLFVAEKIVVRFNKKKDDVLVIKKTIRNDNLKKLMYIPSGTDVILVNDMAETTFDTIGMLYTLGIKHINIQAYYPGIVDFEKIHLAITPNEELYVPNFVEKIINIGDRIIDPVSTFEVLSRLNLINKDNFQTLFKYMNEAVPRNKGFIEIFNTLFDNMLQFETVVNNSKDSIIIFDKNMLISAFNKASEKIFNIKSWEVKGVNINKFLEANKLYDLNVECSVVDNLITINGIDYLANIDLNDFNSGDFRGVIYLTNSESINQREVKYRSEIKNRGHFSKYSFEDILGKSKEINRIKSLAKKFAVSDSTVLIEGKSGTGKELIAHAIHKTSHRRNKAFIAFNCAALNENLVESELFGYVGGAFTGANKNGKAGLFELAHGGTIFLDEIGSISMNMQIKLLRVLQEKEIVRVGSADIIPVDIRIIVATNENLIELVRNNEFRLDLFYRLNILYLKLPELRERIEDIPVLIEGFLKKYKSNIDFSNETMNKLKQYEWPGNIRELENCLEYLINIDKEIIEPEDLPEYINYRDNIIENREEYLFNDIEYFKLLHQIYKAYESNRKIGRKALKVELEKEKLYLTEQEIRYRLLKLRDSGYIDINAGRAGSKITDKGIMLIDKYNKKLV